MIPLNATFATAVRVVDRIHCHTAHRGTLSVPPRASRFSVRYILMIQISELADCGHTIHAEFSDFARRQLQQS